MEGPTSLQSVADRRREERAEAISVVVVNFNGATTLPDTLESIFAQQGVSPSVIVVDDGSTDGTRAVLESFGGALVRVDNPENGGIAEARNAGLERARGAFVAFMDADDIWKAGKLSAQMASFAADPSLDISFTHTQCFLSPDLPDEVRLLRYCPPDPMPGLFSATALAKRSSFDRVGRFDSRFRVGEFIDWFARAKDAQLRYSLLPEVFHLRRIHGTNTGVTARASRVDYATIAREALMRRRRKENNE